MIRVSAEQFRRQLADLLSRAGHGGEQIIVERHGRPIAVLLPYDQAQQVLEGVESMLENTYMPYEQVPMLAQRIAEAREEAGLSYEVLAESLLEERIRTLRDKYPDFANEYVPEKPA